jgi:ABC-type antimicrobial peptide transport system permease subunit
LPIVRLATMQELVAASEAQRRFTLVVFAAFAAAALVLATLGLYGVIAGGIARRMRELGVRSALGASPRKLVGMVLLRGMALTATGVAIGAVGAAGAGRALSALLFGVGAADPVTYAGVVVVIVAAAAAACWIPARRAASVDPSIALRAE